MQKCSMQKKIESLRKKSEKAIDNAIADCKALKKFY